MKITLTLLASLCLLACNKPNDAGNSAPGIPAPGPVLAKVLSTVPSGEARGIVATRASLKPGDEVTLSGRIMGTKSPFVEGRAVFVLGDPEVLTACNEKPGDECETPWDTCCDSPEDKKRATVSIQVVDDQGRVLKEGVEGVGGIDKLAKVVVGGKVAEVSSAELLIINASAIKVLK